MFVGEAESPISVKQERGEVRTEVKDCGDVDGLDAIEVEVGEVGSVLYAKFVNGWQVVLIEGKIEREVLECWQRPVHGLFQEILEGPAKGQGTEVRESEVQVPCRTQRIALASRGFELEVKGSQGLP